MELYATLNLGLIKENTSPYLINNEYALRGAVAFVNELVDYVERSKSHKSIPQLLLAVSILEEVVQFRRQNLEDKILLARLYLWLGKIGPAIELCNSVIEARGFDFLALHIRGVCYLEDGKKKQALEDLEQLNRIEPFHGLLAWNLANAYFHSNKLKQGWSIFNKANKVMGNTYPNIPSWDGGSLENKTILLNQYNSEGGGDDIMFANMIPDITNLASRCYIEVDPRSYPLYKRSFLDSYVFLSGKRIWKSPKEIDFQVTLPELGAIFRPTKSSFPRNPGYLKVDDLALDKWKQKLVNIAGSSLKVGICWRSMISIGLTGSFSTSIEDWEEVFSVPNIAFFNLQYDESEEERLLAETLFGVDFHRLPSIDLMTDFDSIGAVCKTMDVVVSPATTISMIASSVGALVWELRPKHTSLCMSNLPWFPRRKVYEREWRERWVQVLGRLALDLRVLANGKNE